MFNSFILDVVISLLCIYILLSSLTTCVQEIYTSLRKKRGKFLQSAINEVLNDTQNKNYAGLMYQHPMIDLLKEKQTDLPSYIDAKTFAQSLIEIIQHEGTLIWYEQDPDTKERKVREESKTDMLLRFGDGIRSMRYGDLKKLLISFTRNTYISGNKFEQADGRDAEMVRRDEGNGIEQVEQNIIEWYNSYMDRVSGWYKRKTKGQLAVCAVVITLVLNVNFIEITKAAYNDGELRNTLIPMASAMAKDDSTPNPSADSTISGNLNKINSVKKTLSDIGVPIGWDLSYTKKQSCWCMVKEFFKNAVEQINNKGIGYTIWGWLFSIMILSLGAPFWFDILKKLVNIRNTGVKPDAEPEKK